MSLIVIKFSLLYQLCKSVATGLGRTDEDTLRLHVSQLTQDLRHQHLVLISESHWKPAYIQLTLIQVG